MKFLRVRCRTNSEAEDVFQDTFINAYKYLDSYKNRYAFSTWLFNIAVNNLKKMAKRYQELETYQDGETGQEGEATQGGELIDSSHWQTGSSLNNIDESNIWYIARKNLTSEHVELLWFTYVQGYTGQQVAKIMERSLPWVKINLIRCKEKLKQSLESQGVGLDLLAQSK